MVNAAGNGVVAYGELNETTRPAANGPAVTEVQLSLCPEGDLHYSWLEDYLVWLEGKEEHQVYYAWLEQTAPWWEQSMRAGAGAVLNVGRVGPRQRHGNNNRRNLFVAYTSKCLASSAS